MPLIFAQESVYSLLKDHDYSNITSTFNSMMEGKHFIEEKDVGCFCVCALLLQTIENLKKLGSHTKEAHHFTNQFLGVFESVFDYFTIDEKIYVLNFLIAVHDNIDSDAGPYNKLKINILKTCVVLSI